jgi:hypothetical protein
MTQAPDTFLLDPKHRDAIARGVVPKLGPPDYLITIFAALMCLLVLPGVRAELRDIGAGALLAVDGEPTRATVTRRYREGPADNAPTWIDYTYTISPDAGPHQRSAIIHASAWDATCEGCKIDARYSRALPSISRLPGAEIIPDGLFLLVTLTLLCSGAAVFGWRLLRSRSRHRRIQQSGELRMGTILGVSGEDREDEGTVSLLITLTFRIDGDDEAKKHVWYDDNLRGQLPLAGQRVAVVYHSADEFVLL